MKDTVPPPPKRELSKDEEALNEITAHLTKIGAIELPQASNIINLKAQEDEMEDVIETAIDKAAKKHHMRDSTVMLLGVLSLLCAAGGVYVPIELHKRQLQRETERLRERAEEKQLNDQWQALRTNDYVALRHVGYVSATNSYAAGVFIRNEPTLVTEAPDASGHELPWHVATLV